MGLFDRYYSVPVDAFERVKYALKFNGYSNEYQPIGRESVKEIFFLNDIPLEYQRLILVSNSIKKLFSHLIDNVGTKQNNYFAHEFVSFFVFCRVSLMKNVNGISLINVPFYDDSLKKWFYEYISCMCLEKNIPYSEVVIFFAELKRKGLLDNYIRSIRSLFELNASAVGVVELGGAPSFQKCIKKIG